MRHASASISHDIIRDNPVFVMVAFIKKKHSVFVHITLLQNDLIKPLLYLYLHHLF